MDIEKFQIFKVKRKLYSKIIHIVSCLRYNEFFTFIFHQVCSSIFYFRLDEI